MPIPPRPAVQTVPARSTSRVSERFTGSEAGEVGALQLRRRGPGLGRRRLAVAAGAVAMPDQVMPQQQCVLADILAVGLRQQLAGRVQEAAIAGGGLVRAGRQVGEQQIAEHGDAFAIEAGGVEGRGELVCPIAL